MSKFKCIMLIISLFSIIGITSCGNIKGEISSDDSIIKSETSAKKDIEDIDIVTYKSAYGDIEIPKKPKKIVTDYYAGYLIKLEANIVGANLEYLPYYLEEKTTDIINISNLENISILEPDLIIISDENLIEEYSKIAPTICIPTNMYNPEELLLELSKITNTREKATNWLISFNSNIKDLKQDKKILETYSFIEIIDGHFYSIDQNDSSMYFLNSKLGLSNSVELYDESLNDKFIESIGDNLFIRYNKTIVEDSKLFNQLYEDSIFIKSKAYQNNNIFYMNEKSLLNDPFSLELQMESLKEYFEID